MTATASPAPDTVHLQRPGGRIAYDVQGGGPLLVLVPGMGELRSCYDHLVPQLTGAGYRVATTDLRGHGDSDAAFPSYGDPETADDVSALVEHLGGSAVIVGNSLAAGAGVLVAAQHPEQVAGLVLLGPFVRNPPTNRLLNAVFKAITVPLWVARAWRAYLPSLYAGRKPDDFAEHRAAVYASLRRPAYAQAFSSTARQTDHAPAEAALTAVSTPVLVVMGDRDPDFEDPAGEARWIADRLGGEALVVPDAGHYPQSQQPGITGAAVLGFLQRTQPRA